ncbi:MAG: ribonuclease HI [Patescibacteria group bacterium]
MKEVTIYCDGSAIGNPGPGGWGFAILIFQNRGGRTVEEIGGFEKHTTNNRMEITAAIEGLKKAVKNSSVTIKTDSQYLVNGISKWVYGWERNGWKTSQKQDVLNKDLWQELMKVSADLDVTWEHLRAHSGITMNERVDQIANSFARGEKIKLFKGSDKDYKAFLESEHKSRPASGAKAYSYISMLLGKIETHKNWADCEKRVKGQKARFKKVFSEEEELAIKKAWQREK